MPHGFPGVPVGFVGGDLGEHLVQMLGNDLGFVDGGVVEGDGAVWGGLGLAIDGFDDSPELLGTLAGVEFGYEGTPFGGAVGVDEVVNLIGFGSDDFWGGIGGAEVIPLLDHGFDGG